MNLQERGADLLTRHVGVLRQAVRTTRLRQPFRIDACVVLPDHLHCIWTLPDGDDAFSARWQTIKAMFTMNVPKTSVARPSLARRREAGIWQRRYWEHTICDEGDYVAHINYVHFNPVKHGFTDSAAGWPFSTFGRAVRSGMYPPNWAMTEPGPMVAGERD